MSLIENTKEIAGLIKKLGDIDLYRKIIELEAEIIDLSRDKHELAREVESLREKQKVRAEMRFTDPFYYRASDPIPFCPRCWESDEKLIHMRSSEGVDGRHYVSCRVCNTVELNR